MKSNKGKMTLGKWMHVKNPEDFPEMAKRAQELSKIRNSPEGIARHQAMISELEKTRGIRNNPLPTPSGSAIPNSNNDSPKSTNSSGETPTETSPRPV
jgi:hypothetical protein